MDSLRSIQAALEADEERQRAKYPGYDGLDPMFLSARYHTELPEGTQNMKYQWPFIPHKRMPPPPSSRPMDSPSRQSPSGTSDDDLDSFQEGVAGEEEAGGAAVADGFQLDIRSLHRLFKVVDVEGSGHVSQKQLVTALRHHEKLFQLMCRVHGIRFDDSSDKPGRTAIAKKRETMRRLADMMALVDTDFNGFIEWDEFVSLFRNAGLLLQYESREDLNRTEMCDEMEARRRKQEQRRRRSTRKTESSMAEVAGLPHLLPKPGTERGKSPPHVFPQ